MDTRIRQSRHGSAAANTRSVWQLADNPTPHRTLKSVGAAALALAGLLLTGSPDQAHAAEETAIAPAGVMEFAFNAAHQKKEIQAAVWYPSDGGGELERYAENAVFEGLELRRNGAVAAGRHPVVLLSHGLGAHVRSVSWLGAGLAVRGAVVIAVNHPGSTFFDFDSERGFDHWTRAYDLQAALAQIETMPALQPYLDTTRIYASGFSYGGWTALSLGGMSAHLAGYAAHCEATRERSSHCADLENWGIDFKRVDAARWDGQYGDERIDAVAVIDPALHYGVDARHVEQLVDDVTLIGLGSGNDRLLATDFSASGSNFVALVPQARVVDIAPATHFSALPLCKPQGAAILVEENDDPVCTDPAGADRKQIHTQIIDAIATAFALQ